MSKRVFVLEQEDLMKAVINYIREAINEKPGSDYGEYSLTFIPSKTGFDGVRVERVIKDYINGGVICIK